MAPTLLFCGALGCSSLIPCRYIYFAVFDAMTKETPWRWTALMT
jgi:hypothetical protein